MNRWFIILIILLIIFTISLGIYTAKPRTITQIPFPPPKDSSIDFSMIQHKIDLTPILSIKPTNSGNAADYYMKAVYAFDSGKMILGYKSTKAKPREEILNPNYPELINFIEAAQIKECHFSTYLVNSSFSYQDSDKLNMLYHAVLEKGDQYFKNGNSDNAQECYEAVYQYGINLQKERLSFRIVLNGLKVQKEAVEKLYKLYSKNNLIPKAQLCDNFTKEYDDMENRRKNKGYGMEESALWRFYPKMFNMNTTGFVFQIALYDDDPMMREEAIKTMAEAVYMLHKENSKLLVKLFYNNKQEINYYLIIMDFIASHDLDGKVRQTALDMLNSLKSKP